MTIQNITGYIFPLVLVIAATWLNLNENKNKIALSDPQNRVRNVRRKVGIFIMFLTAILITIGIYKLQQHNFDLLVWGSAGLSLIGITAIGIWDIISETSKLRKNIAKECEMDYNNLIEELKKAEIREQEGKKKRKKQKNRNIDTKIN